MTTEKRLIDAKALVIEELLVMDSDYVDEFASGVRKVMNAIRRLPTVDAVEIVRCRECQHWNKRYEKMGMCMKHNSIVTFTRPDFYCAFGERKKQ